MSVEDKIKAAFAQNVKLLQDLSDTEYALSALQQNAAYTKDLINEIAVREKVLAGLRAKMIKERSEHLDYAESTVKRLAFKLTGQKGKFNETAAKEEREYLEALQNVTKASNQLELLKTQLKEAQQTRSELESVSALHAAAQKELDELYSSIFAGPTPAFPEEDASEEPVRQAKDVFNDVQLRLSRTSQVQGLLTDAEKCLKLARGNIVEALDASTMDIWGGGSWADAMERSALGQAQSNTSHTTMLMDQARRCDPQIQPLPPMKVAQGHMMSDIIFDNIFTDMSFHSKIQDSDAEIKYAHQALLAQIKSYSATMKAIVAEADQAKKNLDIKRAELQKVRESLFERVAGGLPSYSEQ